MSAGHGMEGVLAAQGCIVKSISKSGYFHHNCKRRSLQRVALDCRVPLAVCSKPCVLISRSPAMINSYILLASTPHCLSNPLDYHHHRPSVLVISCCMTGSPLTGLSVLPVLHTGSKGIPASSSSLILCSSSWTCASTRILITFSEQALSHFIQRCPCYPSREAGTLGGSWSCPR